MSAGEATAAAEAGSATFRDPAGSLRIEAGEVVRSVHPEFAPKALEFLRSPLAERWVADGRMVASEVVQSEPGQPLVLAHPHIFFPSYPWEWTPGAWIAAGELTLQLSSELVPAGWILKDATPLNVLFEGVRPVFVDVLSPEPREPGNPLWTAYGQFARTFLLPLAAYRYLGWPLAGSILRRDGYEPSDLYPYLSRGRRWRSPFRSLVTIPHLLEKKKSSSAGAPRSFRQSPEVAADLLQRRISQLRRALRAVAPRGRQTKWSDYPASATHYADQDRSQKQDFVRRTLEACAPAFVLDIGGNTGEYSRIAARAGARVVAWDPDVGASEQNWSKAREENLDIQPLVVDAARPTPAVGWRNRESLSLLDRARGRFDCVMMLGVIHHLLLADQIPLNSIAEFAADLTKRWLIVEWVPKTDPRFVDICRGRDEIYGYLNEAVFLSAMEPRFAQVDREELANGRVLFLFEKR